MSTKTRLNRSIRAGWRARALLVPFGVVSFAAASSAQVCCTSVPVSAECFATGQDCGTVVTFDEYSAGVLSLAMQAAGTHCSDVSMDFYVDGLFAFSTGFLAPGESSPLVDVGPVSPGVHTIEIHALGREGGCNAGILAGWGGTVTLCSDGDLSAVAFGVTENVCLGAATSFEAVGSGHGPYLYQWLKDGVAVEEEPGRVSGVTDATLNIYSITDSDAGDYSCIVANGCDSVVAPAGTLRVHDCSPCPADFNQDGGVDGSDVDAFFAAWEVGDSSADVNFDGGVDGADVATFFAAWEAGGCG
ncbi:MAG: hypothetical protein JSR77_04285 [Planctomycetes bacterium]|nr:hypothetical protein [Planctomycetota bacterium]